MWLLDFGRCGAISMDELGVEKEFWAFFVNDPYFRRSGVDGSRDQLLWMAFSEEYLRVSGRLLADGTEEWRGLPRRFVEGVVVEQGPRLARRAGNTASSVAAMD